MTLLKSVKVKSREKCPRARTLFPRFRTLLLLNHHHHTFMPAHRLSVAFSLYYTFHRLIKLVKYKYSDYILSYWSASSSYKVVPLYFNKIMWLDVQLHNHYSSRILPAHHHFIAMFWINSSSTFKSVFKSVSKVFQRHFKANIKQSIYDCTLISFEIASIIMEGVKSFDSCQQLSKIMYWYQIL